MDGTATTTTAAAAPAATSTNALMFGDVPAMAQATQPLNGHRRMQAGRGGRGGASMGGGSSRGSQYHYVAQKQQQQPHENGAKINAAGSPSPSSVGSNGSVTSGYSHETTSSPVPLEAQAISDNTYLNGHTTSPPTVSSPRQSDQHVPNHNHNLMTQMGQHSQSAYMQSGNIHLDTLSAAIADIHPMGSQVNHHTQMHHMQHEHLQELQGYPMSVRLTVGGRAFDVSPTSMQKFPGSKFGMILRGEIAPFPTVGEYRFDRDPLVFETIVAFLRTGKIFRPSYVSEDQIKEEAGFFGLMKDMFPEEPKIRFRKLFAAQLTPDSRRLTFTILQHEMLSIMNVRGPRGVLRMDVLALDGTMEAAEVTVFDLALVPLTQSRPAVRDLMGGHIYEFYVTQSGSKHSTNQSDTVSIDFEFVYSFTPADHVLLLSS